MNQPSPDITQIAQQIAAILEERGCEYAFGGAISLGYWGELASGQAGE